MDVTRSNFRDLLPVIEKAISDSDFLSIDGEFTGLRSGRNVNAFDTPSEYYQTLLKGSLDFLLVQFGLCAFKWDDEARVFKQSSFNFYLFPRPLTNSAPDKIFSCQSSSIDFLAAQKFDFNKLFYEGISYLSTPEELKLRENLEEKHSSENYAVANKSSTKETEITVPDENKAVIKENCEKVQLFLKDETLDKMELDNYNAFIRKLLYQELEKKFGNDILIQTVTNDNQKRVMQVSKVSNQSDVLKKIEEKHVQDWKDLETATGFSLVARKISDSGKLVVGHCLLLDLLHILNQFFSPLPELYTEFKEFAKHVFPCIMDTMYLATIPNLKDKIPSIGLENLLTTLSEEPFKMAPVVPEENDKSKGYVSSDIKYHEAGYDAYTTGLCFISMMEYLLREQHMTFSDVKLNSESRILKPYLNKIYLFKTSYQDSPYIFLGGKDANPSRDHVFHISFPADWKRNNLIELFSPFGGISFSFIDDTSAYVALRRRDQIKNVKLKLGKKNKMFTITPFHVHKQREIQCGKIEKIGNGKDPHFTKKIQEMIGNCGTSQQAEDVGEPILRELVSSSSSTINALRESRRRTQSGSSADEHIPKRRRTTSGVFEVTTADSDIVTMEQIDNQPVVNHKIMEKKIIESNPRMSTERADRVFNENEDWE